MRNSLLTNNFFPPLFSIFDSLLLSVFSVYCCQIVLWKNLFRLPIVAEMRVSERVVDGDDEDEAKN